MTSKERANLRAQANTLQAMFQVGKEGVTLAVAAQMLEAFNTRELLKGKVLLETCPQSARETAEALAVQTESEVVQVVGGSMVFFKVNPELRKKIAEKAKAEKADKARKARPEKSRADKSRTDKPRKGRKSA
ncbi:MAG: YhbY family RNA-binding protein [Desulfovibrionaceae bacterium]|nr:YhbY family RNA-binding protein [Desulfovibrionaceae bacterium]